MNLYRDRTGKEGIITQSIISLIVIAAMIFTMFAFTDNVEAEDTSAAMWNWDTAGHYDISWYNRTDTTFKIGDAEQLAGLAYIVNQGSKFQLGSETEPKQETFKGKTIILTADIRLNDALPSGKDDTMHQWPSIAGGDSTNENGAVFDGTFDGSGHTVENMYIYDATPYSTTYYKNRNRALFGVTTENTTIENVTVTGYICAARGIGGIVGKTGTVKENSYDSALTGHGTMIKNCVNKCTITGGESKGTGGIVGAAWNHAVVTGCSNEGSITASPFTTTGDDAKYDLPVGGIAGESEGSINNCWNTGKVSGCGGNTGGIVGSSKVSDAIIYKCYNTGNISNVKYSSSSCAGGIAGWQIGSSGYCYNAGTVSSAGTGASADAVFGSIFGELKSSCSNKDLYWLNTNCRAAVGIDRSAVTGQAVTASKSDTDMRSADFVTALNSDNVDSFVFSEGQYPTLKPEGSLWIDVTTMPDQVTYLVDETMNNTGMVITAHKYDGTSSVITSKCTITGFDSSKAQETQALTVLYGGGSTIFYIHIYSIDSAQAALADEFDRDDYSEINWDAVQEKLKAADEKIAKVTTGAELQTVMADARADIGDVGKLPSIEDAVISAIAPVTYTGTALTPKPASVTTAKEEPLEEGTDYTVSYEKNIDAGTGTLIITGVQERYRGEVKRTFVISKAAQKITAASAFTKNYGASAFRLNAVSSLGSSGSGLTYTSSDSKVAAVTRDGTVLPKGTGRTVITVTAAGNDNYNAAVKKITVTVTPQKEAISRLTGGRKYMKVTWRKDSRATGYQLMYSRSRSFSSGNKTVTLKSYKTTVKTIRKLRSKKYYYVKVRAYKNYSGSDIYGPYSSTKRVKIK